MKKAYTVVSIVIVLFMAILCQQIIKISTANQTNKIEAAELNGVTYGLLSIDTWKKKISIIVADEIDKLEFTKEHEKELQESFEKQLSVLFDKVNLRIKKSNKGSFTGGVKQAFLDLFVSIEEIKKGIPEYASAMIKELKKPQTKGQLKNILKEKLDEYMKDTFDARDNSPAQRILIRVGAGDMNEAKQKLAMEIEHNYKLIGRESVALIILAALLFLVSYFSKTLPSPSQYFTLVVALLILLFAGVTTPMIDMEAKISQMTFVIFDHPVQFENQVLYFQSKSILDVFWIMITDSSLPMKFVGLLMVLFSVVFPVTKLLSSVAYYYDYLDAKKNKIINFFVFKSGKWSMADVMVVAIFMSYIGFNGIINSQFGKLSDAGQELVVVTTNGTSLRPGYYLFLAYALLAMLLPTFLVRNSTSK
jgi:hypothetical protein